MPLITLGGLEFRPSLEPTTELERLSFTRIKPLSLLTYLTLEGEQHRSFMAQLIWGNAKKPPNSMSQAIDQLVRLLPGAIEKTDTRVKALISSDAADFREAIRQERYLDAIALYQGDFLNGNFPPNITFDFEEWLDETANLLAEEAQMALTRQAQLDLVSPDADIRSRSKEFAEQAYKIFERMQVGEANLQLLYAVLEHHGSVYAAKVKQVLTEFDLAVDDVVLDIAALEQALAEQQDNASRSATDNAEASKLKSNLPSYTSTFFGRKTELKDTQHMLLQPECQLLTLSGPGGMGKTRLATELSHILEQSGEFDVVSFVNLEPLSKPSQIANTIAQTLELRLDPATPELEQLIHFLQDKKYLIVLDNVEHLLEEEIKNETKTTLSDFLTGCSLLKVLVTSREHLDIGQEWLLSIEALNHPTAPKENVAELETFDAVELFVDRAKHANIHFKLDDANLDTVQKLIMQTAGLPLAIELAASWIRALKADAIFEELENSLEILSSTTHTEKHQTIVTTFEHSWQRLSEVEQGILQALSVFEDSFSKEAATFVTNVSYTQLMQLINKSLLQTTKGGRYVLHPLLGQYLDDKLQASGLKAEVQASHAEYYMDYFSNVAKGFRTKKEGEALDAVEVDIENIMQAWLYASERDDLENSIESSLVWELRRFFDMRNKHTAGSKLFAEMANLSSIQNVADLHGSVLAAQAWLVHRMSQYDKAKSIASEAEAIVSESDNVSVKINIANTQGSIASFSGDNDIALSFYQEAVELAKKEKGQYRLPTYLTNLATVQKGLGKFEEAQLNLEQALSIAKKQDDEVVLYNIMSALGNVHNNIGQNKEANLYYQKALQYAERHRLEQSLPILLSNLANVSFELGLLDESESYCEQVLDVTTGESNHRLRSAVNSTLGKIAYERDQFDKAQAYYDKALEIARDYSLTIHMLRALSNYMVILLRDELRTSSIELNDLKQWLYVINNHPKIDLQYKRQTQNLVNKYELELDIFDLDKALTVEGIANTLLKK